jgi:hypothetical protein
MQTNVGVAMGAGTDIAMEPGDIIIVGNEVSSVLRAREISRRSYRTTARTCRWRSCSTALASLPPPPAWSTRCGPWSPWRPASPAICINSIGGRPSLLFDAIASVGRTEAPEAQEAEEVHVAT